MARNQVILSVYDRAASPGKRKASVNMIEQFNKEDFEVYLEKHKPFESLGLIDGEETYILPLDNQVSIIIRSSIKANGLSADVGKDSIRCWLVDKDNKPLGSKISKWTTRQVNWQNRLDKNIKQFILWRSLAGDCKECGKAKGIFKARTEKNKGRPFAKCKKHNGFMWLDEKIKVSDIHFSKESHKPELSNQLAAFTEQAIKSTSLQPETKEKSPNEAQRQAIEANVNTNLRVLAGPGSGKTFVIEHRYAYLVQNGVQPENILVCTFSKAMADEMGKRIQRTCSSAVLEQISTIHAFCYRVLCKWYPDSKYYKWQVSKDWKVKAFLEDVIGATWQEKEKPSAKEVLNYINTSKYLSLTTDESYPWFVETLGRKYGEWLYEIRSKFDAWLMRNKYLTFSDMLYFMEQEMIRNEGLRTMLQDRFSQVIIDESQDTNYQAMRILITVSLEAGQNTVYEERNK